MNSDKIAGRRHPSSKAHRRIKRAKAKRVLITVGQSGRAGCGTARRVSGEANERSFFG